MTLVERVSNDAASYKQANDGKAVPADAVTTSGSGLDPHISPANAAQQLRRVAAARGMDEAGLGRLVEQHTERPWPAFLGQPGVNVLTLNLALDKLKLATR